MLVEKVSESDNRFLSRKEVVCGFAGLGGRLGRLEAAEMVSKELGFEGKTVIPVRLSTRVGMPHATGTFYVYDDAELAKRHVGPTILSRIERSRAAAKEAAGAEDGSEDGAAADAEAGAGGDAADGAEDGAAADAGAPADAAAKEDGGGS
ncbi:MAG: hypothetical protein MPJ06_07270 [Nitrosopumilus sp.]|nr:hypothetical protein [Nitrosopumilus sp.]